MTFERPTYATEGLPEIGVMVEKSRLLTSRREAIGEAVHGSKISVGQDKGNSAIPPGPPEDSEQAVDATSPFSLDQSSIANREPFSPTHLPALA